MAVPTTKPGARRCKRLLRLKRRETQHADTARNHRARGRSLVPLVEFEKAFAEDLKDRVQLWLMHVVPALVALEQLEVGLGDVIDPEQDGCDGGQVGFEVRRKALPERLQEMIRSMKLRAEGSRD